MGHAWDLNDLGLLSAISISPELLVESAYLRNKDMIAGADDNDWEEARSCIRASPNGSLYVKALMKSSTLGGLKQLLTLNSILFTLV